MNGSLEACGVRAPLSGGPYSAVELSDDAGAVVLLDQLRLPQEERYVRCESAAAVAEAIRAMVVRGAPAIGLAAAYGMAVAGRLGGDAPAFLEQMRAAGRVLADARPTAVNLPWAVKQMLRKAEAVAGLAPDERHAALVVEARAMHVADVEACRAMGARGAALLPEGVTCLTHCNAGALATGGYGTALGVVRAAWAGGKVKRVLADETRPYLQGARLTAWELARDGIDVELITDGMAGHLMARGEVGAVVVGADRVARNGDVANKVGTYGLAVLARAHDLPFFVAAPWSTVDMECPDGAAIPIEERSSDEVTTIAGRAVAPAGVRARHPAFDVTPARLVTALITERGVARPVGPEALRRLADESGGGGPPPGLHSGAMANERRERDELRQRREQIDREILALLRQRARLSRQAAARATEPLRPTLPSTERDTLEALAREGGDDVPAPAVVGVFQQIHAVCRALEAPVRAAYVGAEGCRAYVVAYDRFGPLAELASSESVPAALESVDRGRADFAVLPYETSAEGLDHASLAALGATELKIVALHDVTTPLALLSQGGDLGEVERVFATAADRASAQHNLSTLLPRASVVDVKTSLTACSLALEDPTAAALALESLGHRTGLAVAARSVADAGEGRQRFCLVAGRPASRTGRDGTTITFAVSDQPGQLFEVLKPFAERGVNVRTIQSRPPARDEQDTMFYIEVSGHATDRAVVTALEGVKNQTRAFKVLGSYPVP